MRWLHLTDLHIRSDGRAIQQEQALKSMVDHLTVVLRGKTIDAVIISGDVAFSGRDAEYALAKTYLIEPLRAIPACSAATFFICPGNHDVDGDACPSPAWSELSQRRKELYFTETVDGQKLRAARSAVFAPYARFANDISARSPTTSTQVSAVWEAQPGAEYDVVVTNTAWFCDHEAASGTSSMPAPLDSLRSVMRNGPTILVGHHSISNFELRHQAPFRSLLMEKKAVYLHGHTHEHVVNSLPEGGLLSLGLAAAYQAAMHSSPTVYYRNSYSLCEIRDSRLHVAIANWDGENGRWQATTTLPPDFHVQGSALGAAGYSFPLFPGSPDGIRHQESLPERRRLTPTGLFTPEPLVAGDWADILQRYKLHPSIESKSTGVVVVANAGMRLSIRTQGDTHAIECISAQGHVLSPSELTEYNAVLDCDGYKSFHVLTLGSVGDETRQMLLRLQKYKPLFLLDSREIAKRICAHHPAMNSLMNGLDVASFVVEVLYFQSQAYLIIEPRDGACWFYVANSNGIVLPEHDAVVVGARSWKANWKAASYGQGHGQPRLDFNSTRTFDRDKYLSACWSEHNSVRYSALAAVGFRLNETPLERLYVQANADEGPQSQISSKMSQAIREVLDSLGLDDQLRDQLEAQLTRGTGVLSQGEGGAARNLYQQAGAMLVLGDPGSGKTCFAKSEILTYCDVTRSSWYRQHTPLFVPLAEAADLISRASEEQGAGLLGAACAIAQKRGMAIALENVEELFLEGKLAVFLDGVDEVVSLEVRTKVAAAINELVESGLRRGNRFVVTSRPAAVKLVRLSESLRVVHLRGLTIPEMRVLAERVLSLKATDSVVKLQSGTEHLSPEDKALVDRLISDCQTVPGIGRLARNPLLLTLLVLIYANSGAPSAKRHRVYGQAVQTLASVRSRQTGQLVLSEADLRVRLGRVALSVFQDPDGAVLRQERVVDLLIEAMKAQGGLAPTRENARRFLQEVAESTGLVAIHTPVDDAIEPTITFMHHSFLEFYAALGLAGTDFNLSLGEMCAKPRWREILVLLSGIVADSSDAIPIVRGILDSEDMVRRSTLDSCLFAFDCALESEVPAEGVVRTLLQSADAATRSGPALVDAVLRERLGLQIARLFSATDGREVGRWLCEGMSGSGWICAAFIDMCGIVVSRVDAPEVVLAKFDDACKNRREVEVGVAVCGAIARTPKLLSESGAARLRACLGGSVVSKIAALQALHECTSAVPDVWDRVIECMEDHSRIVRVEAARTALSAGLDVTPGNWIRSKVFVRAVDLAVSAGAWAGAPSVAATLTRAETDRLLTSSVARERLTGIQLLGWIRNADSYAHSRLFDIIRAGTPHEEVTAALRSLVQADLARALTTVAESKIIEKLANGPTRDVRLAAHAVLGELGDAHVDFLVTRLISCPVDEFSFVVEAIAACGRRSDAARVVLQKELAGRLRKRETTETIVVLLRACQDLRIPFLGGYAEQLLEVSCEYRRHHRVRGEALLALANSSAPAVLELLTKWLLNPPPRMFGYVCRAAPVFIAHVSGDAKSVQLLFDRLTVFRDVLAAAHARVSSGSITPASQLRVRLLREALEATVRLVDAFFEFNQRKIDAG